MERSKGVSSFDVWCIDPFGKKYEDWSPEQIAAALEHNKKGVEIIMKEGQVEGKE